MPTSGGTTGALLSPSGPASSSDVAWPIPYTLLSLPYFARIMGLNPVHFAGATGGSTNIFPASTTCDKIWFRHTWQYSETISHEELAYTILEVEEEIARFLGYFLAPKWSVAEEYTYPRHHRRDLMGLGVDIRGLRKSMNLHRGRFVEAGRRALTTISLAVVPTYSDLDGDGFAERATVSIVTTETEACEIKIYFQGHDGEPEWEIRPARSKVISGGTFTAEFDSWLFIDPNLMTDFPDMDGNPIAINLSDTDPLVGEVEVRREYTDFTEASAEFWWESPPSADCGECNGTGCPSCQFITQDGCIHPRDPQAGIVVPVPASYDATDERWEVTTWSGCREPDMVKLWYKSGMRGDAYLRGATCEPLDRNMAQIIAYMATARLDRPICGCKNITDAQEHWSTDLTENTSSRTFFVTQDIVNNPFGTRRGEVFAYKRLSKLTPKRLSVAVI